MNAKLFNKQGKDYAVTSPYGIRNIPELGMFDNYHIGTDYAFPQGTGLVSPLAGEVLKTVVFGDYGGQVFLYIPVINKTLHYAHLTRINVNQGEAVSAGSIIGYSGGAKGTEGAGTSTGAHLHIGIASGRVTSVGKGAMGDGLWIDIDTFDFTKLFKVEKENGVFTANTTINVRDFPDTAKGKVVAQYFKGESVKYHGKTVINGHVWIVYTAAKTGETRYMAVREYKNGKRGPLWGTIK